MMGCGDAPLGIDGGGVGGIGKGEGCAPSTPTGGRWDRLGVEMERYGRHVVEVMFGQTGKENAGDSDVERGPRVMVKDGCDRAENMAWKPVIFYLPSVKVEDGKDHKLGVAGKDKAVGGLLVVEAETGRWDGEAKLGGYGSNGGKGVGGPVKADGVDGFMVGGDAVAEVRFEIVDGPDFPRVTMALLDTETEQAKKEKRGADDNHICLSSLLLSSHGSASLLFHLAVSWDLLCASLSASSYLPFCLCASCQS